MNETFGTRLRLQRERQQIDLTAISASTKISLSLLERLERDDVEHWPVGIFRRAYVRAYATAIGLDPETVLREFLERYPEPKTLDPFSAAEAQTAEGAERPPGTRLGQIVRSAMAAMPGFLQRPSRPELSRMNLAVESADDRESWDHDETFDAGAAVVSRRDHAAIASSGETARATARDGARDTRRDTRHDTARDTRHDAARDSTGDTAHAVQVTAAEPPISKPAAGDDHELRPAGPVEPPAKTTRRREPDLVTAAALCTRFARVRDWREVDDLLAETAGLLDAVGLVVWSQTDHGDALSAILAHGYPPAMIARMPVVPRTADNAIADAFRSGHRSVVSSDDGRPGALVVPLVAATGCAGVLALELADGAEQSLGIVAFAEIVAAQLAPLLGAAPAAEAVSA